MLRFKKFDFCRIGGWLFFLLATFFYLRIVIDPDLGWHLAIGKYIWQTRAIPKRDLFSFTLPNYPYVYHSWLTDLILFLVNRHFGLSVRGFGTPRGVSHCGASKTKGKPRASARGGSHFFNLYGFLGERDIKINSPHKYCNNVIVSV